MCRNRIDLTDPQTIWEKWDRALSRLCTDDEHLLITDCSERAITHRLGVYLQEEFPQWNVDCEYNRIGVEKKALNNYRRLLVDAGLTVGANTHKRIYPDIIVHCRGNGSNPSNILAIEVKKTNVRRDRRFDTIKLQCLREELGYLFTVFVELRVGRKLGLRINDVRKEP